MTSRKRMPDLERVLCHLEIADCWNWTLAPDSWGYGFTNVGSTTDGTWRRVKAHRFVYESLVGEIPKGLDLDHLCRNRLCSNPDHLEPVTRKVNLRRSPLIGKWKRTLKTQCIHGHSLTNATVRKDGSHWCRECKRLYDHERYRRGNVNAKAA